jgi:hypothetical protein
MQCAFFIQQLFDFSYFDDTFVTFASISLYFAGTLLFTHSSKNRVYV